MSDPTRQADTNACGKLLEFAMYVRRLISALYLFFGSTIQFLIRRGRFIYDVLGSLLQRRDLFSDLCLLGPV